MTPPSSPLPVLLLALAVAGPLHAQQEGPPPCSTPEYRQFDFWVGEWDVFRPDGQPAGHNSITVEMGGCVVHESYSAARGPYHGESFNIYDRPRGLWHQTWVDNGGTLLRLEGGWADDRMVLSGEVTGPDGSVALHRITWSRIDGDPDRVRQLWETTTDGGASWSVVFDGEYRRQG